MANGTTPCVGVPCQILASVVGPVQMILGGTTPLAQTITGPLTINQPGGTPTTDALVLNHDGTESTLTSNTGGFIISATGDQAPFDFQRTDATNNRLRIFASDGGNGARLQVRNNAATVGQMRIDCTFLKLFNAGSTIVSLQPVNNVPVIANTDGTTAGWMQNTAGEAALNANFTNATATLAATNLSWNVQAGRSYRIFGVLQVSNSTAGEGVQIAFDGGSATATTFFAAASAIGTVTPVAVVSTTLAGVINYSSITGTDYIIITGYLKVNAAGTLTLRAAENTHATGTLTIGAGSWIALADTVTL